LELQFEPVDVLTIRKLLNGKGEVLIQWVGLPKEDITWVLLDGMGLNKVGLLETIVLEKSR